MLDTLYPVVMGLIYYYRRLASAVYWLIDSRLKRYSRHCFKEAGIMINTDDKGPGNLRIHNEEFYHRLAIEKTLGLGEMYMEGWWDCDRLDVFFTKILKHGLFKTLTPFPQDKLFHYLQFHVFNLQTSARSWEVADKHYNLGNELFGSFLDSEMNYS
ncbi:unnamed protein product, partial [Allacma fusca]